MQQSRAGGTGTARRAGGPEGNGRRGLRRMSVLASVVTVAALALSACTSPGTEDAAVTVTSTVAVADLASTGSSEAPPSIVVVPPLEPAAETTPVSPATEIQVEPTSSIEPTSTATSAPVTPTRAAPPKPKPKPPVVTTVPGDGAAHVDPLGRVTVSSKGGQLTRVALYTPAGKLLLGGKLNRARTVWTYVPELGYGKTYTFYVTAKAKDGSVTNRTTRFTTLVPSTLVTATSFPRNGMTVGVGQPISITFDHSIRGAAAKAFVEKQITVRTFPVQAGKFRWFSDRELHWRPAKFWHTGTKVKVDADIYGKNLGNGVYGRSDLVFRFAIQKDRLIATVNDKTHQMVITRNGKTVKTMPVSLGTRKYPTYNGTHIVAEKYRTKVMDSRTWGLTGTGAYRTTVKWATRISSSGEFVHAAPWSVYAQGNSNVSHGCVNVSEANAKWFYDTFGYGDPVIIKNTSGPRLKSYDGYGDWQIAYKHY